MTPEEVEQAWELSKRDDCLDIMVPSDVRKLVAEIQRLRARCLELIPIWNAIEQTRATIESTARLMGEAGHPEQQKMMHGWHEQLHAALNTRIAP